MYDEQFTRQHLNTSEKGFRGAIAVEYFEHRTPRGLMPFST